MSRIDEPRQVLTQAGIAALNPHATALRERGWDAQLMARVEDDKIIVSIDVHLESGRIPIERQVD